MSVLRCVFVACVRLCPCVRLRKGGRLASRCPLRSSRRDRLWVLPVFYVCAVSVPRVCARAQLSTPYCIACTHPQVDPAHKDEAFKELYHAVIPLRDVRERVPMLVSVLLGVLLLTITSPVTMR